MAQNVHFAAHRPPESIRLDEPEAILLDLAPIPPELIGRQPVAAYISRALAENRTVQAARFNVLAMKARIPQVTALDDPVVSNTIYPIPSVALQYSLMGYNPYNLLIAQQFPWLGTLRLTGQAAEQDVKVALAELAAAELDAVAGVKRAYQDLYFNEWAETILVENRKFAADILEFAKVRYTSGGSQQDYLRAEVALADIDRELVKIRQGLANARADMAQLLHVSPESDLRTLPQVAIEAVPAEVDRLYRLAFAGRPELRGRLAAIARDERAVELARKRYYPNIMLGLSYMDIEKTNAQTPKTAGGFPNVGLFFGFNLPIYRQKLAAGVCEAESRAIADAKLYDAERDATYREVKDLLTQAKAQRDIIALFRERILPRSEQALKAAASDYQAGNVDYVTLIVAWREVLQIELQVAQVEAELGKAMAPLERTVGVQLNEHPPATPPRPQIRPRGFTLRNHPSRRNLRLPRPRGPSGRTRLRFRARTQRHRGPRSSQAPISNGPSPADPEIPRGLVSAWVLSLREWLGTQAVAQFGWPYAMVAYGIDMEDEPPRLGGMRNGYPKPGPEDDRRILPILGVDIEDIEPPIPPS